MSLRGGVKLGSQVKFSIIKKFHNYRISMKNTGRTRKSSLGGLCMYVYKFLCVKKGIYQAEGLVCF